MLDKDTHAAEASSLLGLTSQPWCGLGPPPPPPWVSWVTVTETGPWVHGDSVTEPGPASRPVCVFHWCFHGGPFSLWLRMSFRP